ncbi:hypothetical protein B5C26_02945 [Photorhabdus luminescens]|uniref:helix-turn-helix domain-containing protein n=1 Tax=Photorhabdus TaxID=29487 RepID=UPI000B4D94B6|nr:MULTISPECIES: helix-turn-helix domain-containing protein [Photorhabdus]MCW7549224.1 helix-turn-helix domain-containing protein [Photorhabdus aballayi]OWO84010.1 hypothetical protein B5C26_02945 [Photorhabdus luminescens]
MAIRRAPRPDSKFYTLDKSISEDTKLSWGARGLLIYLLGKPDNWEVSVANLINQTQDSMKPSGRDAVRALLKELANTGYLQSEKKRGNSGNFDGMSYVVCESGGFSPETDYPSPDEPLTAEPLPDNPPLISNELKQELNIKQVLNRSPLTPQGEKRTSKQKFDPINAKPSNVSSDVWVDWVKFRREIKKPLTETMCRQQAKKLADCHNADEVICTSIANGWQGLFPRKLQHDRQPRPNTHTGFENKHYESIDAYWSKNIEQGDQ